MQLVRLEAVRWYDDEFPGRVEVELHESDGTVATLIDKAPVFDAADALVPGVPLPVEVQVPCDVLRQEVDSAGRMVAVVRLHYGLEDLHGRTTFRINADRIVGTL